MGSWILRGRRGARSSFDAKDYLGIRLGLRFAGPVLFLRACEVRPRISSSWLRAGSISATKVELADIVPAGREGAIGKDFDSVL
jgi:hypothetical protein